jgi:hypothetical protein
MTKLTEEQKAQLRADLMNPNGDYSDFTRAWVKEMIAAVTAKSDLQQKMREAANYRLGEDPCYEVADFSKVNVKTMMRAYADLYALGIDMGAGEPVGHGQVGVLCEQAFRLQSIALHDFLKLDEELCCSVHDYCRVNADNIRLVLVELANDLFSVAAQVPESDDDLVEDNGGRFRDLLEEISRKVKAALAEFDKEVTALAAA